MQTWLKQTDQLCFLVIYFVISIKGCKFALSHQFVY